MLIGWGGTNDSAGRRMSPRPNEIGWVERISKAHSLKQVASRAHGLDTLRSLAILSVVTYHVFVFHDLGTLPDFLVPAATLGWMGVDLFFVLSGYLIGSQLLRPYLAGEHRRLWDFYRNRLYRVLPRSEEHTSELQSLRH